MKHKSTYKWRKTLTQTFVWVTLMNFTMPINAQTGMKGNTLPPKMDFTRR